MIPTAWVEEAARRLRGQTVRTPLTYDPEYGLYLKWENRQLTGSFKIRGALNKLLTLQPWELERGLVTASAGNHGQGLAYAARLAGAHVQVFASSHAVPAKLDAMRALGAEVTLVEGGYAEAELAAIAYARNHGTWVSPYNDGQIIAGQATLTLELFEQGAEQYGTFEPRALLVPTGGGGLVSGAGAALQYLAQGRTGISRGVNFPLLVAVQSEASPFMHDLYHSGSQDETVDLPSLADGLAGLVEPGSITIPLVKQSVDRFELVTEDQIGRAVAFAWHRYGERIEGSAAATLAAVLYGRVDLRPAAVILSGGNIQPELFEQLCRTYAGEEAAGIHKGAR